MQMWEKNALDYAGSISVTIAGLFLLIWAIIINNQWGITLGLVGFVAGLILLRISSIEWKIYELKYEINHKPEEGVKRDEY